MTPGEADPLGGERQGGQAREGDSPTRQAGALDERPGRRGRRPRWRPCRRASTRAARSSPTTPSDEPTAAEPRCALPTSGSPASTVTFSARPGRRSKRLTALAAPATTAPPSRRARADPRRTGRRGVDERGTQRGRWRPRPTILTAPVVTSPRASAPRWPFRPLSAAPPARSSRAPSAPAATATTVAAPAERTGRRGVTVRGGHAEPRPERPVASRRTRRPTRRHRPRRAPRAG